VVALGVAPMFASATVGGCASSNWQAISPDDHGSFFAADFVVEAIARGIDSLFLDTLLVNLIDSHDQEARAQEETERDHRGKALMD